MSFFSKTNLIFFGIISMILLSSCSFFIHENKSAAVMDVSVKGYTISRDMSALSSNQRVQIREKKLTEFKTAAKNPKSSRWVSPVNDKAKIAKRYSKSQPRISFIASPGDEIFAARDGRVEFSGEVENLGLIVILKHTNHFATIYINNYKNLVNVGQSVKKGQLIAQMGMNPQNPKQGLLYFEVRKNNINITPHQYF